MKGDTVIDYEKEMRTGGFEDSLKRFGILKLAKECLKAWLLGSRVVTSARATMTGAIWMRGCFSCTDGSVLWMSPNDVECFWAAKRDGKDFDEAPPKYYARTKSGAVFCLVEDSWMKLLHGMGYSRAKH